MKKAWSLQDIAQGKDRATPPPPSPVITIQVSTPCTCAPRGATSNPPSPFPGHAEWLRRLTEPCGSELCWKTRS